MFSEIFKRPGDNMFSEILKRPGSSSILLNVYLQRLRTLARFIILLKAENTFFVWIWDRYTFVIIQGKPEIVGNKFIAS